MALPEPQEQMCFSPEELLAKDFAVDEFVARCRRRVTMEGLREELHGYFKTLKSAMVELINQDYADFVNLSANLAGIDKSIGSLMSPLKQLQTEIKEIKCAMTEAIDAAQSKMNTKTEISEQKNTLTRLIVVLESMERLERLLHIHSDKDTSGIMALPQTGAAWEPVVMERVAMEFNKLQYNASLVTNHPLIESSNERISGITQSVQLWLESSFRAGLAREDRGALISCLQTYNLIGRHEAAEAMFRTTIIHPYIDKLVTTKNLISHAQGLGGLYADILTFVPKACSLLVSITSGGSSDNSVKGFDFLVNSVWPEMVSLIERKISVIFAPGNPDTFHQNYTTTMDFVSSFEKHCSTESSIKRLRAHPTYNSFMAKWSLPVYFQIRFQDIAGSVESSLSFPLVRAEASEDHPFQLEVFGRVWLAWQQCWSPDVLIPALTHRFWKLSLQVLMRTAVWLEGLCTECSKVQPSADGRSLTRPLSLQDTLLVIADLEQLSTQSPNLAKMAHPHIPSSAESMVQEGLEDARQQLDSLVPRLATLVVEEIASECSKSLESAQTIPRLFRRTGRQVPSKPSTYVAMVLRPLEVRLSDFPSKYKKEWTKSVVELVTENYYRVTSELLLNVKRTEDSLLKLNAYRKSSAPSPSEGMTDDNKISWLV
ncbi:conserved oligomeric Golgi complex subunit 2-like isoform X2 [Halichondria panicea]|uniref:conserved oligomeric Golgi complex subunit 2-like isoform X2 n=1 Tax=Halichondria panicea TaxID=6063 RepID=UPI00312BBEED